jgi:hypothetical protein
MTRFSLAVAFAVMLAACGGSNAEETAGGEPAIEQTEDDMSDEAMNDNVSNEAMEEDMSAAHTPTAFTVTIQNTSDSAELATPLAPGLYAVHSSINPLFAADELDRGQGLEALAEDGDPKRLLDTLAAETTVKEAETFAVPGDATEAGPARPGSSYNFTFEAVPGDHLSFATMFVQSNDWFFAPAPTGIALFDGAEPVTGEITDMIALWDAGTEVDETPGEGANQAPRQAGPNTGDAQNAPITTVDGFAGSVVVWIAASG